MGEGHRSGILRADSGNKLFESAFFASVSYQAAKHFFGKDTKVRFRPSYFPFTEPSVEVDVSCAMCHGKGCKICKGTGWIEILGAGIVNRKVLRTCGIDPDEYTGFAFGFGIGRIANIIHGIPHIKLLYENDIRFLEQFR